MKVKECSNLTCCIQAQVQDTEAGIGRMTDIQVRDEVMTIFLAGHETTSNALTWTFYLLSQNPTVGDRMYDELQSVLGDSESGRTPKIRAKKEVANTDIHWDINHTPTVCHFSDQRWMTLYRHKRSGEGNIGPSFRKFKLKFDS